MESILPSSQSVSDLQGPRFLDPPSAKSPHIQAMETRPDHLLQSSRHGLRTRHCSESRLPWFELVAWQYGLLQYRLARSVFRCDRSASSRITSTFRTAWCGPACKVVWERSVHAAPIPIKKHPGQMVGLKPRYLRFLTPSSSENPILKFYKIH